MTDLHEYVDGIEPLARIDSVPGGKIWQTKAKAYVAAAPTPGGSHLLVLQSGRFDPTPVASWVLQHALANWDSLLAEDAPLRVAPGLPPLGDWPFDVVVAFPPDLHNFEKRKHPDVHERAFQVFPACRYEVPTALSEREAVSLKSPKVVRFTDVERVPVPIVRVRYELASQRSVGKDRALSKLTTMRTMVEQLAESPNGFVEIENHRAEVVRIEWSGEYQVVVGDERARVERAEIWPWLQRFARTGSGAGGSGEPGGVRSPAEFSLSPELSLRLEDGSTMDSLADWQLRQELERLRREAEPLRRSFAIEAGVHPVLCER